MRLSKYSRIVPGAVAVVLAAGVALAQEPAPFPACTKTPTEADVESAKQSHLIAKSRFELGDWDKAIEFWRQAYDFDCSAHAILVNIANSHEKKGDKANAIVALETYLTRAKDAPDLVQINERVLDLKRSLQPAPPPTATATATATVTAAPPPTTTAPPTGPRPYGPLPLVIAGVGGALALTGAILIPVGLGPYNEAADKCPGPGCTTEVAEGGNSGRATWNAGAALLGIGVAAAAGGLVFQFVFNKPRPATPATPPPAPKAQVLPLVSPELAGMAVTGRF